jgi:molybdopterin-containing oxidoreductase family iron-sulfur binding subunit
MALQSGVISVNAPAKSLTAADVTVSQPEQTAANAQFPFHLVPSARLGLWDGRHANLPWLQEAPDHISKLVWDSWAEIHPSTAAKMDITNGDLIKVSSEHGSVSLKAVLLKGVHPDVIAIPMGQGHDNYGQFADGIGVNPLKMLSAATEKKTGELALYATRVNVAKTGEGDIIVRMGGSDSQAGRKFVATVPAKQVRRTEGA